MSVDSPINEHLAYRSLSDDHGHHVDVEEEDPDHINTPQFVPHSSSYSSLSQLSLSSSLSETHSFNGLLVNTQGHKGDHLSAIGRAAIPSLVFTLSNTILGAGVLGIAHAFASAGYMLGFLLLCLSGCCSAYGLFLLSCSARKLGMLPSSFHLVAKHALPSLSAMIDVAIAVKCFVVSVSYLIIIGQLMPPAIEDIWSGADDPNASSLQTVMVSRHTWIILFMLCITLPLSCLRSLHALRFTSTFSIIFISALAIIMLCYTADPHTFPPCSDNNSTTPCTGSTTYFSLTLNTVKLFPVFIFAFTCAQNIFTVYNELYNNTTKRVNAVIVSSISLGFVLYTCISLFAYSVYGDLVMANVLSNYPPTTLLTVIRILIAVNVAFTYPLQINPCRLSLIALYHEIQHWRHRTLATTTTTTDATTGTATTTGLMSGHAVHNKQTSFVLMTVLTSVICGLSFLLAYFVADLSFTLSLVGATGSTMISYILPGACYLRLHKDQVGFSIHKIGAWCILIWGLIIMPLGVTLTVLGTAG